jgi:Fic-DOC domain mobile mystery protein B
MSKFKITYPSGATPIDLDEIRELIPDYISTMEELNQLEQANIADAFFWAEKQSLEDLLSATFVFKLHEQMFNQVWKWAGKMRKTTKNIGVAKERIMNDLAILLKDADYWLKEKTYSPEETAIKVHHRLVQIHVFPNGNGRHARLMTDLLLIKLDQPKFSWGSERKSSPIEIEGPIREEYISALRYADNGDFDSLIKFARS